MPLRYYPISKVKTDLISNGIHITLNGIPYKGKYYETYDGKIFSGPNPIIGQNEELTKVSEIKTTQLASSLVGSKYAAKQLETSTIGMQKNLSAATQPVSYFPYPLDQDYKRGYINRYFIKKINSKGYVTEISPSEYGLFSEGQVNYDVSMYLVTSIAWKLTGPLNTRRLSQYDVRAGIVDTNKRLVESANVTFIGLKDFIGEDYAKWAKPTQ